MTTTSSDAIGGTPQQLGVMRRSDPGGEEILPGEDKVAGEPGLGFLDLLDIVNPLQHLPVVGTIYRALTGDTISDAARMAGGALYGGPLGLISALANVVVAAETGDDIGGNAMAWLNGSGGADSAAGTAVAANPAAPATAAEPINAAPVTTAAALASPSAQPGIQPVARPTDAVPVAKAGAVQTAQDLSPEARPGKTDFRGRSADRLDAFIQQASAVRRSNPLAVGRGPASPAASALAAANPASPALGIPGLGAAGLPGQPSGTAPLAMPGAIDSSRLQAAALKPPTPLAAGKTAARRGAAEPDASVAVAGSDASSVNQWMLQALDKYDQMRKQESS